MAQKRDYSKTPPTKLTELNKDSMLDYVIGLNDEKEEAWIVKLFDDNREKKTLHFDTSDGKRKKGDEIDGYNMKQIRIEFAKRYFSSLLEEKPKKKAVDGFNKRLEELRKKHSNN